VASDRILSMVMQVLTPVMITTFALFAFRLWMRHTEAERGLRMREIEVAEKREEKRREDADSIRYDERKLEEEKLAAASAGPGSGGYIVVDMPEQHRPLFHDLLKGFEDYAKLKGYAVAFSIDSSFEDRIGFKFTMKNDGFAVGAERVRRDFKEYMEQVHRGDVEGLDDLPVITSIKEHQLVVTMLKNRLMFIQHNYRLAENTIGYYERLISGATRFPALPANSVVVNVPGGNMDSRSYNAVNSQRLIQGDSNAYEDASIHIGASFNERQERVVALDDVLGRLQRLESADVAVSKAIKGLSNAKDELTENPAPVKSSVARWLEYAKDGLKVAVLGADVNTAAQKLMALFGMHL
jgi:hypothetical protein